MQNDNPFPHQRLDAYQHAKELARVVSAAKIAHAELRDQAERAAISVFLNASEGLPNDSVPMRRRYFTTARNSLFELVAAVDLAATLGAMSVEDAAAAQAIAWRVRGMLVALLR